MTVKELKEALGAYPDDMAVYFEGKPESYFPVEYTESIAYCDGDTTFDVLEIGSFLKPRHR